MILCGFGALGLGWYGRRRRKHAAATASPSDATIPSFLLAEAEQEN
jgi:uncharacterized protein (TIGR03382 family)